MKDVPDATYRFYGAVAVIRRLRALTRLVEGVCRGDDVEYVHKMRVASRRLRTGLTMFKDCFPSEQRKSWKQVIEKVTQNLGPARDLDVQIEFVSQFAEDHTDETLQPGLRFFLQHLRKRRDGLQRDVAGAVKRLRKNPMLRELRKHLRKLRRTAKKAFEHDFAGRYSDDAHRIALGKILRRYRKFLAYEAWVADPSAGRELHEMRIAAKRLRYAMEIFDPLRQGRLGDYTETIKGFQQVLGELHDCDVWMDILPAFLEEQRQIMSAETFGRIAPGLQALLHDRKARREERYKTFHRNYRAAQANGFWKHLLATLNPPPAEAPLEAGGEA